HARTMGTDELRKHFLAEGMFADREIRLVYTHYDRMTIGGAVPAGGSLTLDKVDETRTATFLERREMGIVNIGETGSVATGDESWTLEKGDVLYLGKGNGAVTFSGHGRFYLTSCPAHASFPNRLITLGEAAKVELGDPSTSNKRVINQFIHPLVMESCQLVLGYTELLEGSVWNTMPAHVHDRRMEAYLYWGMDAASRVIHLM
ncbi:MAG: 5-dehydro-4-deoxy-D-glucuronate isomerase, partial [Maritimibacter sp.]|nr:5-dehydro-4-deoxy-D-glucuronate isomerase [Maritimibacter sp.]